MKEHEEEFLGQFRHLHQHPELSFQEHETTAYIKKKLEGWGLKSWIWDLRPVWSDF